MIVKSDRPFLNFDLTLACCMILDKLVLQDSQHDLVRCKCDYTHKTQLNVQHRVGKHDF